MVWTFPQIITTTVLVSILLGVLANVGMLGFLVNHETKEDCPDCVCGGGPVSLGGNADFSNLLSDAALGNDLLYALDQIANSCVDDCLRRYCKGPYRQPPCTFPPCANICTSQPEPFPCCIAQCTGNCLIGCACSATIGPTASAA